jgi:PPOX class probable FMN-dependent enzyme
MSTTPDCFLVRTSEQLDALFGPVAAASLKKEVPFIHPHYAQLIQASPFAVLATSGPGGLDISPRGDPPGFVQVLDERTLAIPERRGNNRIDSLRNILADPRVAVLFLIPGVGETLRVNGRARITTDPDLLRRLAVQDIAPNCAILVEAETVFFQCARAIRRSGLWQRGGEVPPPVPSPGAMLEALSESQIDGAEYDAGIEARQKASLYQA